MYLPVKLALESIRTLYYYYYYHFLVVISAMRTKRLMFCNSLTFNRKLYIIISDNIVIKIVSASSMVFFLYRMARGVPGELSFGLPSDVLIIFSSQEKLDCLFWAWSNVQILRKFSFLYLKIFSYKLLVCTAFSSGSKMICCFPSKAG